MHPDHSPRHPSDDSVRPGAFARLRAWVARWASHPKAVPALGIVSFAESSFFPIPPDVMLVPMCLTTPSRAYWYATVTTATSVLGGLLGYLIGHQFFDLVQPSLLELGYGPAFELAKEQFAIWGFWLIVLAGLIPVPYKVCTITAGVLGMPLLPFVLGSIIGRGKRFYLEAFLLSKGKRLL